MEKRKNLSEADLLRIEVEEEAIRKAQAQIDESTALIRKIRERPAVPRQHPTRVENSEECLHRLKELKTWPPGMDLQEHPLLKKLAKRRRRFSEDEFPKPDELRALWRETGSLGQLAKKIEAGTIKTVTALQRAGINVYEEIALEWDSGMSLRSLTQKHEVSRQTLSKWIKKTGRPVAPRNGNRSYDKEKFARAFAEKSSVNNAARAVGISWERANRIIKNGI
ncbi:hypothetical protein [Thioclava sp. GXIMD4216]|uniref:hypothetical protein n=1 Tax=Thioclava sp. GXIMD4216 TaxID=3131929 RepID=UPI0030D08AEA